MSRRTISIVFVFVLENCKLDIYQYAKLNMYILNYFQEKLSIHLINTPILVLIFVTIIMQWLVMLIFLHFYYGNYSKLHVYNIDNTSVNENTITYLFVISITSTYLV